MFTLVADTSDILSHPVLIIHFQAIEGRKHDCSNIRMHQE